MAGLVRALGEPVGPARGAPTPLRAYSSARPLPNVLLVRNRQEAEAAKVADRGRQPVSNFDLPVRQSGPERRRVSGHDVPMRAHLGQYKEHANGADPPAALSSDKSG
jgi:hypothetical protein